MSRGRKHRKRQPSESSRRRKGGKRQSSESRRSIEVIPDEPVVNRKREPYRPDPISEKHVPEAAVVAGRFKVTGAECNLCGWRTRKPGFNGRQAVRAHMKVHANRRRSYSRPVLRQSIALVIVASGLLAVHFARTELGLGVVNIQAGEIVTAVTISSISVVIGVALLWSIYTAQSTYSRTVIRTARMINIAATIVVMGIGTLWILGSPRPQWYGLVAPVVLIALTVLSAGEIGLVAHGARKGKWRSSKYSGLVRPNDEDAEFAYSEWRFRIINAFRRGKLDIRQLHGPELLVVRSWLRSRRRAEAKRSRPRRRRPNEMR